MNSKDEGKKLYDKCNKLTKELKSSNVIIKSMEEELQKAMVSKTPVPIFHQLIGDLGAQGWNKKSEKTR